MPLLDALARQLPPPQRSYAELLRMNLEDIASPFTNRLSRSYHSLTPTELAICNMIRNGMKTREIAETRGISEATVNHHREKIRRKLGLTNEVANLATFLQTDAWRDEQLTGVSCSVPADTRTGISHD